MPLHPGIESWTPPPEPHLPLVNPTPFQDILSQELSPWQVREGSQREDREVKGWMVGQGWLGRGEHWLPTLVPAHEWHLMNLGFSLLVLPQGTATWDWLFSITVRLSAA